MLLLHGIYFLLNLNSIWTPRYRLVTEFERSGHVPEQAPDCIFSFNRGQAEGNTWDKRKTPSTHATPQGSRMPISQPSLPTNRAFVVQFRTQPAGAPSSYEGRVEHLVSGQVSRFHSLKELLAFMTRVLTEVQEQSRPQ